MSKDEATITHDEGGKYYYQSIKKKGAFETKMDYHKNPSFLVIPKAIEAYFVKGQDYRTFIKNHEDLFDFFGGVKKKSNFNLNFYRLKNIDFNEPLTDELLIQEGFIKYDDNKWTKSSWDYYNYLTKEEIYKSIRNKYSKSVVNVEPGQKVTRIYVAQDGRKLYKDFHDGRRVGVLTEWLVEPCNLVNDSNAEAIRNNLNYNFYIKEAEKIITSIEGNSNQLVLFT